MEGGEGRLLWSLEVTARQLGGVSTRTVRRLLASGELPAVRVGRLLRVPAASVRSWVDQKLVRGDNVIRAEPGVRKEIACHTDVKIAPSIGSVSPTQAAQELGVRLKLRTVEKPKRSKPNGK
ncbi:MAG: helix-turn-helix domain-containing protein [Acidiferrobacter sp.]